MEGIEERDELVFGTGRVEAVTDLPGKFDGCFVCFSAGVADECLLRATHGARLNGVGDKELAEGARPFVVEKIG